MWLYRALLRLYPASFRAEYGREMRAVFEAERRRSDGLAASLFVWARAIVDVVANAWRAHTDILVQDLRYILRTLRRAPGFAAIVLLVSAIGIGATTAAFAMANHVFLRPLPFPESHELVQMWQDQIYRGYPQMELSPGNFRDWDRMATSFDAMSAYSPVPANLIGAGEPERLDGILTTWDLFDVLGVHAELGRTFVPDDDRDGAPATLILSHTSWRRLFAADPTVLGRKVILDDEPHEIIGVMPAWFQFPNREAEFWKPARFPPGIFEDRTNTFLRGIGRLRDRVSLDVARAEMQIVTGQLERQYPEANKQTGATLIRLREQVSQRSRQMLVALGGAAACVLLIACTNLASLLLARATTRRRELAVRIAMGAGAERLLRQMLTESLLLASIGGVLGVLLAAWTAPLVGRLVPITLPISDVPGVDWRVVLFAASVTGLTGIAFGVLPALRVRRDAALTSLREGPRGGTARGTERLRSVLVVAEISACVVLLAVSGLFVRALARVLDIDPGFSTKGVLTLRTALPASRYAETSRRMQFLDRVLADLHALPGVQRAAYISFLPMVMRGGIWAVSTDGRPHDETGEQVASLRQVTPGFFETLDIPLLAGRDVQPSDTASSAKVAVVSRSFVRQHWREADPIGRRIRMAFWEFTVVGVVGDVRVRGLERTNSEPQVYIAAAQVPDGALIFYAPKDLAIRSAVPPATLVPAVRRIIASADPQQPVSDVRPLADIVGAETETRAVQLRALVAFAAVSFVLAALGIHGLLAFRVSARFHEFGVRRALGARSGAIVGMVVRQALALAAAGLGIGALLAWYAGRSLESLLAGISPADAVSASAAMALTLAMAVLGSVVPALRAVRVDPVRALRAE